jgi:RNA polymerase sigma-70 factor (ECF subfamily)
MLSSAEIASILLDSRSSLCALAWVILRDPHQASDVFQDIMVQALEDPSRFQSAEHLRNWARQAARHRAIDGRRRGKRRGESLPPAVVERFCELNARQQDQIEPRVEALERCLEGLPVPARKLIQLRYGQGLSCDDVAEECQLSLAATYQRLSRLHRQLRDCIERRLRRPQFGEASG